MLRYNENRLAFVVGNGAYQGHAALANPANDATAVAKALEKLGFQVYSGTNLDYEATEKKFAEFEARLAQSDAVDVALIYYSGHGLQDDDTNYLVPVGAEGPDKQKAGKLVVLQDLIDRVTPYSKRRLVILDACRNNPAAKKLTEDLQKTRGFLIDGNVVAVDGLAEVEAATNTFLAFAAAPGRVAYDGKGGFSPFTEALLRHIEGVDLPLMNLTIRVRLDVLAATDNRQHTWDHSSLTEPFFFNPSSLLLLIGNAIGLAALMSSLVPYSLLLKEGAAVGWFATGTAILAAVLILFLIGLHSAYARLRGDRNDDNPEGSGPGRRMWQDAGKGVTGGVFGGIIAAFIITVAYRQAWARTLWPDEMPPFGQMLTEITVASIFVAATLGAFSLIASSWSSTNVTSRQRTVAGAILGGIAAGIATAPFVTLYFGRFDRPFLEPEVMAPGAILGTAMIAFAIVNYSLEKFTLRRLVRSAFGAFGATIVSFIFAAVFLGGLYAVGVIELILEFVASRYSDLVERTPIYAHLSLLFGGLIYGLAIGPILGLLIGLTLIWTPEGTRAA